MEGSRPTLVIPGPVLPFSPTPQNDQMQKTLDKAELLKTVSPPNFVYSDISVRTKETSQPQESPAHQGSVTLTPPRRALTKTVRQQTLRTLNFGFTGVKLPDRVW